MVAIQVARLVAYEKNIDSNILEWKYAKGGKGEKWNPTYTFTVVIDLISKRLEVDDDGGKVI